MNRTGQHLRFSPWPIMLVLVAIGMAVGVFVVTQSVQQREARVAELNHKLLAEQQTLRVLDAEWAYLTRPQRLESLIVMKAEKDDMPPVPAPIATLIEHTAEVEPSAGVPEEKAVAAVKKEEPAIVAAKAPEKPVVKKSVAKVQKKEPVKTASKAKAKQKTNIKDDVWQISRKTPAPSRPTQQFASVKRAGVARPIIE